MYMSIYIYIVYTSQLYVRYNHSCEPYHFVGCTSKYFSFFVEPENCSMACGFVLIRLSRLSPCWTPPGFVLDLFMLRRVYNIGNISRKGFLS